MVSQQTPHLDVVKTMHSRRMNNNNNNNNSNKQTISIDWLFVQVWNSVQQSTNLFNSLFKLWSEIKYGDNKNGVTILKNALKTYQAGRLTALGRIIGIHCLNSFLCRARGGKGLDGHSHSKKLTLSMQSIFTLSRIDQRSSWRKAVPQRHRGKTYYIYAQESVENPS